MHGILKSIVLNLYLGSLDRFRCSWPRCGKEFTVASRLTTHFRIHSGKPPYLCGYKDCQKAFHTSSSLSHHRVVHTDQGLRPYVCR
ncbi:hypothetical protein K457DRAFT_68017, partial [Linnemannia elongata AG-77]